MLGVQPLFLLADSRPLFWSDARVPLVATLTEHARQSSRAVYLGASTGDAPEFFELFVGALAHHGVYDCHHVSSSFSLQERMWLEAANVIVLGGGDVAMGWRAFETTGIRAAVEQRYAAGATIIGVSAGAVQIGTHAVLKGDDDFRQCFATFGLCPFLVDVHDEANDWTDLQNAIHLLEGPTEGFGIPLGGGLAYFADNTVEAMGRSAERFIRSPLGLLREVLVPRVDAASPGARREPK